MDKRCRSRGQSLSTVIPQGSPQAIQLINKLLAVDPVIRPTAHQALTFDYLKDAEILCDYEKQYLQRPPSTLFDFESEKYSLEQLKELIVGEVRLSAVSNQELRAKLGMPEEEPIPIEIIKKNDEVTPTAVINNTVPSDIPAVARGTISFNAVTNATAFAQAAAVAAQAAAATTQRRMSSSNNDIKANASVGANGNKYDFHNGPRDNEGRSLRRTSASEPCNSNNQNNVVNNTKTIDSSTTLNEQYLAREAQMDTNTTQRANVGSKILFSSASNNATTTPSNIAAIARDVDAVKIAKSSSSTTTNSNTAPRRLSEGNSLRQASTSEKADKLSQRSSTGGMQSERTSDRISDRISERSSGAINGNAIVESQQSAPYGHVLSTVSRGPKTPSPRKMDVIMAKGAKAKKQSLESGANDDQATASSDNLTAANIDNSANGGGNTNSSSSFLKNRHFGFMRSATASSSRPISANDNSNSNSTNSSVRSSDGQSGQTAGLSSLLSQFSGRYQSLSSRAKSAAGTGPAAAVDRSGELITKPVALKPVRQLATTVPQTAV